MIEVLERAFDTAAKSNWQIKSLGDVCRTSSGGTPSRSRPEYFNGNIPWVKSGELTDGLVSEVSEFISEAALAGSSAKLLPAGTLMIAMYGATVGKLGVLTRAAATNQAVCAIFPPPELDPKFLFWYLRRQRSNLIAKAVGGAQPNISQTILRNLELPIPPIAEQREIVAEIEKQFSRIDQAVVNLQRVKANLKRYKASVLESAFRGDLMPTLDSWQQSKLGDVCRTTSGGTPSRSSVDYFNGEIPWVKSGELTDGLVYEVSEYISQKALSNSSAKLFPVGTLLIAMYGATVGKLGVLGRAAATNQAICAIFPGEKVYAKFLFWFLRHQRSYLMSKAIGGAQPNISQTILRDLILPLPSISDQILIVAEIDRQLSIVHEVEAAVDSNLRRAQAFRQATLFSVFTLPKCKL